MITWLIGNELEDILGFWQFEGPEEYLDLPEYWPKDTFNRMYITDDVSAFWSQYLSIEQMGDLVDRSNIEISANDMAAISKDILDRRFGEVDILGSYLYLDKKFTLRVSSSENVPAVEDLNKAVLQAINKHYRVLLYWAGMRNLWGQWKEDKGLKTFFMYLKEITKWSCLSFSKIYLKKAAKIKNEQE